MSTTILQTINLFIIQAVTMETLIATRAVRMKLHLLQ